ncbi:MAG: glutamate synthase subunit alpha, partial [Opitutae bacterium]|nr:glutamate synthase subunit alpha [Opitutae bacterium]
PIGPIREEIVTASVTFLGSEGNLTKPGPESSRMIKFESPLVDDLVISQIKSSLPDGFKSLTLGTYFDPNGKESVSNSLKESLNKLFSEADSAIENGANLLILSDREISSDRAAIPSLLACSGLHHHLIRKGTRTKVSLIVESGEPREVQHFALLLGYGADLINPYLALETVRHLISIGDLEGLNQGLIDTYFTKTPSRVEGIGLDAIAREAHARHQFGFADRADARALNLDPGGVYQWRANGEKHLFNPTTIHKLQKATRLGNFEVFREYSNAVNDQSKDLFTLRGLMDFKADLSQAIPLDEVEPASEIVKRFKTGAMSYGSISKEAHESLAIAMNRLGGKSNTGEGGEDLERFTPEANGDSRRSAIKQVASGRFGVTSFYLVNSDEIQIKIVQGAKPGEGGELPGHKVLPPIAKTRGTTPGVGLISPPPHHDIYSIEDLAELIHDLKNS